MTTVVCYGVGDDEHITYIDTAIKILSLWEELVKNSETLEQIAAKGVGQNTLKQIGGSWSSYPKCTE